MNFKLNFAKVNKSSKRKGKKEEESLKSTRQEKNKSDDNALKNFIAQTEIVKKFRAHRLFKMFVIVAIPIFLFSVGGITAYSYLHSEQKTYPKGDATFSSFASNIGNFEYSSEQYSYSDYALPLPKLPDNYDTAKNFIGKNWQREQMILILRNGFVEIPYEDGMNTMGTMYAELLGSEMPLIATRDAILAYAYSSIGEVKAHADSEINTRFKAFLSELGEEALKRSRNGETEIKKAYRENAINYFAALRILFPEAQVPREIRDEIKDVCDTFEKGDSRVDDDLLFSAMNCLRKKYARNDENSLRMRILSAGLMKQPKNVDEFQILSSYFSFFYGSGNFFDIKIADEAVSSTVGYGAKDVEVTSEEVILKFNELLAEKNEELDLGSIDILKTAEDLGIQKACELNGNVDGPCKEDEAELMPDTKIYDDSIRWFSKAVVSTAGVSTYNFLKSSDWDKKEASIALWSSYFNDLEKISDKESPSSLEIPDERGIYLDPNPLLYSRLAYGTELISSGLEDLDLLDEEDKSRLSDVADDLEQLSALSKKVLSGESMTDSGKEAIRDLIEKMAVTLSSRYVDAESRISFYAVHDEEGRLLLAAGPTISYIPEFNKKEMTAGGSTELTAHEGEQPDANKETTGKISPERISAINSFLDWLPIVVSNDNFDEPYSWAVVPQAVGTVRIPVLMYHQITPSPTTTAVRRLYVKPESFEEQLAYLAAMNYRALTPQEFYDQLAAGVNPSQKSVMLTFDDSVSNHYTNAFPLLQKYGFVGVFYVVSHRSGITAAQLKEMSDAGMIIDSHSETHRDFLQIDDAALWEEIGGSKTALEAVTGKTIVSICYPGCTVDDRGINIVASSGYKLGFSCGRSIDHTFNNRYVLSRIHVYEEMDNFQQIFSGIWGIPASYYQ